MTSEHTRNRSTTRRALALPAAGLALLLTVGLAGWSADRASPGVAGAPASVAAAAPPEATARTIGAGQDSYASLVEKVAPAVVTVRSERRVRAAQQVPFSSDPFFREFFGDRFGESPRAPDRRQNGLGSGVIVSQDGYILTNHHVVDGAQEISVELTDRRSFDAKVMGSDPPSDLAVLKIEATGLPTLPLGSSDGVRVGDVALAIGNPLGVGQTVTMGIISAKGRATGLGDGSFEDFLQTDAPINQGNSGGALVNTRGELIGINSQILTPTGGNIGIGFAIPASMARQVMDQLIETGEVRRGMLGVTVQGLTSDLASGLGLDRVEGALVSDVTPGSAADKGGIRRGDVILEVNGTQVADSNALRNTIARLAPGSTVTILAVRDGQERTLRATLGELPSPERVTTRGGGERGGLGLTVQPLTPDLAERLDARGAEGLAVTAVQPGSRAEDAGLRAGDIILEVDRTPVRSAAALRDAVAKSSERPALVLVQRQGSRIFLTIGRATS
jgi:Do/DeqQ family serine protease